MLIRREKLIQSYIMVFFIAFFLALGVLNFTFINWMFNLSWWFEALIAWNVAAFALFAIDSSMGTYPGTPYAPGIFFEVIAILGGAMGIIWASEFFRHPARREPYMWKIYVYGATHVIIYLVILMRASRWGDVL